MLLTPRRAGILAEGIARGVWLAQDARGQDALATLISARQRFNSAWKCWLRFHRNNVRLPTPRRWATAQAVFPAMSQRTAANWRGESSRGGFVLHI
jgi:hypothetical protein